MAAYMFKGGKDSQKAAAAMARLLGPGHVDQMIRQAIHFCWLSLPPKRKNAREVEKQMRRIFERAIRDFREDSEQFGRAK